MPLQLGIKALIEKELKNITSASTSSSGTGTGSAINWRGNFSNTVSYAINDAVEFTDGSSYICIQATTAGIAPTNATYWNVLARAGQPGSQGIKGDKGDPGVAGSPGPAGSTGQNGKSLNWRGAWGSGTTYNLLDAVSYNGSSYVCVNNGIVGGTAPDVATGDWNIIALKGDVGPQGPAGTGGSGGVSINDTTPSTTTVFSGQHTTDLLAGKANSTHTHAISDIANLQTALDGKQATLANASTLAKLTQSGMESSIDISNVHTHTNKTVLDNLSDNAGVLNYKSAPIGGPTRLSNVVTVAAGQFANIASGKDKVVQAYLVTGYSTVVNTNQAIDSTKAFASRYSSTLTPSKAFDLNDTTYWSGGSGSGDWYIGYDFGAGNEQAIGMVRVLFTNTTATTQPTTLAVEYSDDNVTWVQTVTNDKTASTTDYSFYTPNVGKRRYWRIRSVTTDATAPSIKTIEFRDATWIEGKKIIQSTDNIQINYDDSNVTVINNSAASATVRVVQL
jgi:hypothetical protein